ncbi:MAG: hypothetical protein R3Y12_02145 [Clostridia bacterium]
MNKFINGVIAGVVVGSVASATMNSFHSNTKPIPQEKPKKSQKNLGKTLHTLGDMAENLAK